MSKKDMVRICYYTSRANRERIEKGAETNKKSVSSVVDDLLEIAFDRQERNAAKLNVDEINAKIGVIQSTINALHNNVIQVNNLLDSHLKNTSSELERTVKNLIKEMEIIFGQVMATEDKNFKLIDGQIYRTQIAILEIFKLHFPNKDERNKAIDQLVAKINEKAAQFKTGKRTV